MWRFHYSGAFSRCPSVHDAQCTSLMAIAFVQGEVCFLVKRRMQWLTVMGTWLYDGACPLFALAVSMQAFLIPCCRQGCERCVWLCVWKCASVCEAHVFQPAIFKTPVLEYFASCWGSRWSHWVVSDVLWQFRADAWRAVLASTSKWARWLGFFALLYWMFVNTACLLHASLDSQRVHCGMDIWASTRG